MAGAAKCNAGQAPLILTLPHARFKHAHVNGSGRGSSVDPLLNYSVMLKALGAAVSALAAVGGRLWAGLADGRIRVIDVVSGAGLREWQAHNAGVASLAPIGTRIALLGMDGAVKLLAASVPCDSDAEAWCVSRS